MYAAAPAAAQRGTGEAAAAPAAAQRGTGEAEASPEGPSRSASSTDAPRHDQSTETLMQPLGGELEFHLRHPSLWPLAFLFGCPVLCLLNGCSYYLFWRACYFERAAVVATLVVKASALASPGADQAVLLAQTDYVPSLAFYGVTAGFAFAFVFTQWVVQVSARAFITAQECRERAAGFRWCGALFILTFLPVTVSQMILIGEDYHLGGRRVVEGAEGTAYLSHRYRPLWVVTFLLTTLSMVLAASAMWSDMVVNAITRRIVAHCRKAKERTM